uniref:Uncharacterized protein n=1 Tax=Macaca fascicularis TaxID=9541 RepID=A0A7N9IGQ8_MACFA
VYLCNSLEFFPFNFFRIAMVCSVYISFNERYACTRLCRKHCFRFNRLGLCPFT